MLAIFENKVAHPPKELSSPASTKVSKKPKLPEDTLKEFLSKNPNNSFSMSFGNSAALAYVRPDRPFPINQRQYGLSKGTNDAMIMIEAYRTLRDRGPYPADQVVKDLEGSFAFVIYDHKARTLFTALASDGKIKLFWGIAADGSVVISDELEVVKGSCAKSFAPFPTGCMFHSENGLMNYEHPVNKMKAMPRVDSEGVMCGANFKVDTYSRINSMPRVGSETNWCEWSSA
ncbi:hypothetical protein AQUCO_01600054v1 [Aquilegia coerulea]|uniref:DUF3700 domain-containing protein n=1 Tax=Aquilegia coerulea TaxID=218851 RepID=A0A2G5DPY9_AQUCA|nr:hypothetical protein AQUCO_01600054v1 [Aquilegia coerulea]